MTKKSVLKNNFKEDLFLSAKRQPDDFNNKSLKDAIKYYEIKERNIMSTKRPDDWLTAWQLKNER
jgi:hypothetical protein